MVRDDDAFAGVDAHRVEVPMLHTVMVLPLASRTTSYSISFQRPDILLSAPAARL